jgi:hypothetical protein
MTTPEIQPNAPIAAPLSNAPTVAIDKRSLLILLTCSRQVLENLNWLIDKKIQPENFSIEERNSVARALEAAEKAIDIAQKTPSKHRETL